VLSSRQHLAILSLALEVKAAMAAKAEVETLHVEAQAIPTLRSSAFLQKVYVPVSTLHATRWNKSKPSLLQQWWAWKTKTLRNQEQKDDQPSALPKRLSGHLDLSRCIEMVSPGCGTIVAVQLVALSVET
jgi:hypothetical protein